MFDERPDLQARAMKRQLEKIAAGLVECTCKAPGERTNRHGGHAPDCQMETAWTETIEEIRNDERRFSEIEDRARKLDERERSIEEEAMALDERRRKLGEDFDRLIAGAETELDSDEFFEIFGTFPSDPKSDLDTGETARLLSTNESP